MSNDPELRDAIRELDALVQYSAIATEDQKHAALYRCCRHLTNVLKTVTRASPPHPAPPPSPSEENAGEGASDEELACRVTKALTGVETPVTELSRANFDVALGVIREAREAGRRQATSAPVEGLVEGSEEGGKRLYHAVPICGTDWERLSPERRAEWASAYNRFAHHQSSADAATIAGLRKAAEDIGVVAGGLAERGEHHDAESLRRIAASLRPEPGGGK